MFSSTTTAVGTANGDEATLADGKVDGGTFPLESKWNAGCPVAGAGFAAGFVSDPSSSTTRLAALCANSENFDMVRLLLLEIQFYSKTLQIFYLLFGVWVSTS